MMRTVTRKLPSAGALLLVLAVGIVMGAMIMLVLLGRYELKLGG